MSEEAQVIVSVDMAEGAVQRVEHRLRDAGFEIDSVMEFTGVIAGRWNGELDTLRALPEVVAVEMSEENFPM